MRNLQETFHYDNQNRLTEVRLGSVQTGTSAYDGYGRMTAKTADGQAVFSNAVYSTTAKPHAMDAAETLSGVFPSQPQNISYTCFDKVSQIMQGSKTLNYTYGYDHQRIFMEEHVGTNVRTKRYVGNCEYVTETSGNTTASRWLTYLSGPTGVYAVVVTENNVNTVHYILKDNLGSWTTITNSSGTVEQQLSYDAWGNLRNQNTWTGDFTGTPMFDRGYTGHEHLYNFGLINMIGRFFSPDPFVQAPDFTQNFNRYSYCMNNPVMYSDPDGENALLVVAAIYFLYFTEPGYEVQKYISPIAINNDIRFGSHQKGLGFNISFGIPKSLPYARRWEEGSSYYWKNYGDYRGYEHRKGSEQTVLSLYHWGDTHYESGEFTQTVGKKSFGIPSIIGVDVSNDLWGDGGDRFRTSHQRINCFPFYIGGSVFTGDPGMKKRRTNYEPNAASNQYYIKGPYGDPDKYRYGILYVGAGPFQRGWDSEGIRHILQNIIGHNWISPESPWFKYIEYEHRLYRQFGWGSLW